jgi:hypothetical protein
MRTTRSRIIATAGSLVLAAVLGWVLGSGPLATAGFFNPKPETSGYGMPVIASLDNKVVRRVVDEKAGVVCWLFGFAFTSGPGPAAGQRSMETVAAAAGGGIACLPISQTQLDKPVSPPPPAH